MKNEKELKYAALMAKAYNWLNEFSCGKGHEGFGFAVSQRGDNLFQGRGDGEDIPKTSFYVEIGKRIGNYTYLTLDFHLTKDFARITKICAHMGWQEPNDAYKTLAQLLSNNIGDHKSATIQIVEAANEDGVKQGLQNWLSEHCVQIVTAYGQDRRPEDKVRADRLTQLKNNGFLSVGEDGIVSISQTADFVTGSNNLNGEIKVGAGLVPPPDGMPVNHDVTAPVNRAYNRLVFGAPGTGKSHRMEDERKKDSDFKTNYERVTFYPTYSYAQFVGTYKPVMKVPEGKNDEEIAYEFVPGPFLRVLVKALNEAPDASGKKKGWCLIIEEINRANAAAVFGDVFQLLDRGSNGESEYAIAASEDVKKYLEKKLTDTGKQALNALAGSTDKLKIPANMYLWATMNSADQGVTPLDTAFKRRWEFE